MRHYNIVNNCPSPIDLYISGYFEGTIASGASTSRDYGSWDSKFIYTSANGGSNDGITWHMTRAAFYGEVCCCCASANSSNGLLTLLSNI